MAYAHDASLVMKNLSKKSRITSVALTLVVVVSLAVYTYPIVNNAVRKQRIVSIYNSLHLDDNYLLTQEYIFGEKKPYDWDKSRSFSSMKQFVRDAPVSQTAEDLKKSIEAAGFTYFDEPYAGSMFKEYHFKSKKNEYIRINVSSKPRNEAFRNRASLEDALKLNPDAAPSSVTIKVNLDDNNE